VATTEILRFVLRAEEPPETLTGLGFSIEGDALNLRVEYPSGQANVETFPLSDLATGLVRAWAHGTDLHLWASVVLMVDWIDVDDLDSPEGEVLRDALWSAAGGDQISDEALTVARRLSDT